MYQYKGGQNTVRIAEKFSGTIACDCHGPNTARGIGSDPKEDFQEFPYDDYSIMSGFGDEVIQWVINEARSI